MKIKGYLKSQKGVTAMGAIIFVIIATIIFLFGLVIAKPFMSSLTFNSELDAITKNSFNKSDETVIKHINTLAREKDLSIYQDGIKIERDPDGDSLTVTVDYYYELNLPYYEKTLNFNTRSEYLVSTEKASGSTKGVQDEQNKAKGLLDKIKEIFGS